MLDDLNHDPSSVPNREDSWLGYVTGLARRIWPVPVGLAIAILGATFYSFLFPAPTPLTQDQVDESVVLAMASATPPPAFSARVYQVIFPSLVFIQGPSRDVNRLEEVGIGSGVVVNGDGDILTALHVVAGLSEIEVHFTDGTRAAAEIIASQPEHDIAVIHPDRPPEVIVPAVLGNPNAMRVGDETYAVGNPLGLAGSLSAGVISGFDRSIPLNDQGDRLEGLIQFDAAVNPGNSGGPLLNRFGQVIGIVTALANPIQENSFSGIGFAVPIETAAGAANAPPI